MVKTMAVIISIAFIFALVPEVSGAQFYFKPRRSAGPSGEIGVRIPFGKGSAPERESVIEKLKEEKTSGLTGFGLIILGLCVVTATLLIVNKADDVKDDVLDRAEEIKTDINEKYEEVISDLQDEYDSLND